MARADGGMRDDASPLCKKAAEVVGPARLLAALVFLGEDAVATHPHAKPTSKRGPVRDPLITSSHVYRALREAKFNDGHLVKLIRSSDTDWLVPPCPELVARYHADDINGTGHERLKNWFKQMIRRRGWKGYKLKPDPTGNL
jgi:hypothetical protein